MAADFACHVPDNVPQESIGIIPSPLRGVRGLKLTFSYIFLASLCGFLFLVGHSRACSSRRLLPHNLLTYSHTTCPHTQLTHTHNLSTHNLLTHNLSTHNLLTHTVPSQFSHTTYSHTQLVHTQLTHTQLVHTQLTHTHSPHNSLTQLTHTQLTLTQLTHTQLAHTQLLSTHNLLFAWQAWRLWHWAGSGGALGSQLTPWTPRLFAWQAWRLATLTFALRGTCGTWRHRRAFCVPGLALGDMDVPFAWQAWPLVTSTCTLRGRCGTFGPGLALVAPLGLSWRCGRRDCLRGRRGTWQHWPSLCVAGLALGDIDRHFAWQDWRLVTSMYTLRGRRGTYGTGLALVARLGPSWCRGRRRCFRGRRGAWRHWPSLCVAGVARGDIDITLRGVALGDISLCVAGVALGDIDVHFAWQAWHLLWHWKMALVARLGPSWRRGRRGCLGGTRGTWRHRPSLCLAGVARGHIDRHFAWQAWQLVASIFSLRGRCGTWWHRRVAPWTPRQFAWQVWRLVTSTCTLRGRRGTVDTRGCLRGTRGTSNIDLCFAWQVWHLATSTCILRGRRGTWWHRRALCLAGVALMALALVARWVPVDAVEAAAVCVAGVELGDIGLHFAWQAWHVATLTVTLRGRPGTWWHRPSLCVADVALRALCVAGGVAVVGLDWLWWRAWVPVDAVDVEAVCVAGVALGNIDLCFAWQAWRLATWTVTLPGRPGTWWHRCALCLAGVALMALDWLWWRAWVLWTRGRRGPSLCMAGVARGDMDRHFAWQAWRLVTSTFTLRGRCCTWWPRRALCVACFLPWRTFQFQNHTVVKNWPIFFVQPMISFHFFSKRPIK